MSYWGAQVIISLFGALPWIGDDLALLIRGDFVVSDVTLNRFFAFHVIALPLLLCGLVGAHLLALHEVGSNNPDGVEIKKHKDANGVPLDGIAFHPYYTVKDLVGAVVFLIIFYAVVFFSPEMGGYFLEHANFVPADPLKTPEHIAPVWYFTPFYAILRAVPNQLGGVIAMGSATFMFFLLPWLDRSPVKSIRYRGWRFRVALALFTLSFLILGVMGVQQVTPEFTWLSRFCAIVYFLYFFFLLSITTPDNSRGFVMYYKFCLRSLVWALTVGFTYSWIRGLQANELDKTPLMDKLDSPHTYFVIGLLLLAALIETFKFYRQDVDAIPPERVRWS
jgi:ubiquinol-cytochrome c reductase cytochrome b subunit